MNEQTDERTDICECRVAFATEKLLFLEMESNTLSADTSLESPSHFVTKSAEFETPG